MTVCDCMDIEYDTILEAVKKYGDNMDAIMDDTEAGTVCECCQEDDCDKVDLPLPLAIQKRLYQKDKFNS